MFHICTAFSRPIINICLLAITLLSISCQSNISNLKTKDYQAISNRDTAYLRLTKHDNFFYGHYLVNYGGSSKDSGEIRGNILGDTLKGDYFYYPRSGGVKKRSPFALLQKGSTLKLGTGSVMSFMDIPYYSPSIPINYDDVKFIFHEITTKN